MTIASRARRPVSPPTHDPFRAEGPDVGPWQDQSREPVGSPGEAARYRKRELNEAYHPSGGRARGMRRPHRAA